MFALAFDLAVGDNIVGALDVVRLLTDDILCNRPTNGNSGGDAGNDDLGILLSNLRRRGANRRRHRTHELKVLTKGKKPCTTSADQYG